MKYVLSAVLSLLATTFSTYVSAEAPDYTGSFWIEGHYAIKGDPVSTRVCGEMQRYNQVDSGDESSFDYLLFWYTDDGILLRIGSGIVNNRSEQVNWYDSMTTVPGGQLYLWGEGGVYTTDFWGGKLWDAEREVGMRSTQFWLVPLNPGDSEPPC